MAINAQNLIEGINNSELSQSEQIIMDYLERMYDKEILSKFYDPTVSIELKKDIYFSDILKAYGINKGRYNIIFAKLQELYDNAGWYLKSIVQPQAEVLQFTIKPI